MLAGKVRYTPSERLAFTANVGRSDNESDNFGDFGARGSAQTHRDSASLQGDFGLAEGQLLSTGVDWSEDNLDGSSAGYLVDSRRNTGVFVQYQGRFGRHQLQASARNDDNQQFGNHATGSLGWAMELGHGLRVNASYGTAFKAPTLADQFQGVSGFYSSTVDYYNCALLGFDAGNVDQCPARYSNLQYFGQQSGNPDLKPINAKVWSYGVVWAPTARFSVSADYYHWNIKDEVALQNVDQLMRDEANCRLGTLDINSGTCQAALSQVHRGAAGTVQSIDVKKVNIASESLNAVALGVNYRQSLGAWGELNLSGNWTRNLKHEFQQYPGDPTIDLLSDPYWSTDPKYKASASAGWNLGRWTTTVYANYLGPTPNYRATLTPAGYGYAGAGRLGSYTTLNASVNFDVTEDLKLSLLVNNLANRMPNMDVHSYPGSSGAPYNSSNFDVLGRAYYLEAKWSFGKSK